MSVTPKAVTLIIARLYILIPTLSSYAPYNELAMRDAVKIQKDSIQEVKFWIEGVIFW